MKYAVAEKKGESLTIGLRELEEGHYELSMDGRTVMVDAVRSGRMIYSIIEDGRQFEAMVDEQGAHGFDVLLAGHLYHMEAVDERTKLLAGHSAAVASGPQRVEAEMPGKVVKVHLRPGDPVQEGQGVVIVEAMKMENEIPSPIEGLVGEIGVSEGDTVDAGVLLFTVDLPPSKDES